MDRQSLTMQQNFNADELAEEKELFSDNDITNDLGDFSGNAEYDFSDWLDAFPTETVNKFAQSKIN